MRADRASQRILMTADAVGGVWPYVVDLSRALIQRGYAVDAAVMGPAASNAQRSEAIEAGITLHEAPFRLEWMNDCWDDVDRAAEWLLDLDRSLQPAVVHLNGFCHGALPWRRPALMVAHSSVCSWWRAVHGEPCPARYDRYRQRVGDGLRAAPVVVAPTAAMLQDLVAEYGPLPHGRVIPNGRTFTPANHVAREPIVFSAGRLWDEAKNIQALCAAAPRLAWPVFIAGDTASPDGSAIVSSGVRYLGRLDGSGMRDWYARASIYVLPARYEPFGLSVLEAARSGCALVLGDIRSLRENWNGAAVFVPPDNRRALESAIEGLIHDGAARAQLAAAAMARAGRFTTDRMADAYAATYTGIFAGLPA